MQGRGFILSLIISLCCLALSVEAGSAAERAVIIGFKHRPGPTEKGLIRAYRGTVKKSFRLINACAAVLPVKEIARLRANPHIKYLVEDRVVYNTDPELSGAEYENSWGVLHIGCERVHAQGITGRGIRIAVLDTGIDYDHPDLHPNYQGGYDFVNNDDDPFDDSTNSHGTHVAGIIAASLNGLGVVGGAPQASLYAVKIFNHQGVGRLSSVIAGIEWAVENRMDIVNLSFAGLVDDEALKNACDAAYNTGLLLVAAAGNYDYGWMVYYPAGYDSVIGVAATDQDDQPAVFSPTGPEVKLAAPGVDILSTAMGGGYQLLSGTSQAAPHVTAVAALIMSAGLADVNRDGIRNNRYVRQRLQQTAVDLGAEGHDNIFGYGLVNADAALGQDIYVDGLDVFTFARQVESGTNSLELQEFAAGFGHFNMD